MLYTIVHTLHKSYRAVFDQGQGANSCIKLLTLHKVQRALRGA